MQIVSQSWEDAHRKTLLDESFVEISMDITDPDVIADATASDNGSEFFGNTEQVVSRDDKSIIPYATLEQNLWLLNGSREVIPRSDYGDNGYISNFLSDSNCEFNSLALEIKFSQLHSNLIPGITITWGIAYNEYATEFSVIAYNGNTVVASKEITNNKSIKTVVNMDIIDFDRIMILPKKWCLPYRRARISEVFVGINDVYTKSELFSYKHSQTTDPISTTLPKNEIQFSLDNTTNAYNPLNESGSTKYLMERQEVRVRYGLKINNTVEWIKGGRFYLSEWNASQNGMTADFTARDLFEFMSAIYKETITQLRSTSLYDLAIKVLEQANLPLNEDGSIKWIVDDSLKHIYSFAPLPDDTLANCLQLIANAGRCVLYQDRQGMLHIEPIHNNNTDYAISFFNAYSKPDLSLSKIVKNVTVKVHQYVLGEDKSISDSTYDVTVEINDSGESLTIDNPLITSTKMAKDLAAWIGAYYSNRTTLKSSWRADVQLDTLDIVNIENDYGSKKVRITDLDYSFTGAFRGTCEGRVI